MAERLGLGIIPGAGWRAAEIRAVAREAEDAGFDAIFTAEVNNAEEAARAEAGAGGASLSDRMLDAICLIGPVSRCRGSSRPSAPPGSICRSCPHRSASTAHARSYARSGVEPILPSLRREAALLEQ